MRAPSGMSTVPNGCPAPKSSERPPTTPQCAVLPTADDAGWLPNGTDDHQMLNRTRGLLTTGQPLSTKR